MEVILLKNLERLGNANEIVTVKNGYGRNFLIPQKLAIIANKTNRSTLDDRVNRQLEVENLRIEQFKAIAAKLEGQTLRIGAKAGTSGKIFGSVTNVQIAQVIQELIGDEVDRRKITLLEEVKNLGGYTAQVQLHEEVGFNVNFEVFAD
ncbi:MAG: large subunit ribosomal protein L9 [Saprospiraceae bacterium]|jgi:large subunit ribosomal protein L9|tara:strand:- start:61 stop:507 length:447 start_codon:yes stop_codon:yes gene_type:complete